MDKENNLNPGVTEKDVEDLQAAVDERDDVLSGLSFVQSLVMAVKVQDKIKHVQISLFSDDAGELRIFFDVIDPASIHVSKSDSPA